MLVKPQFEAGRADVGKGGVVRDPRRAPARRCGRSPRPRSRGEAETVGVVDSGLPGPEGKPGVLPPPRPPRAAEPPARDRRLDRARRRVSRPPRGARHARQAETIGPTLPRVLEVAARSAASSSSSEDEVGEARAAGRRRGARGGRPRGRARRRRDDAARARPLPRHGRPGARRQLRPRRLPHLDPRRRARDGPRARVPRRLRRRSSCRRSRRRRRRAGPAVNDVVVRSATSGAWSSSRWSVGGEDLGAPAVRRGDLLDAVGLDRLQPLERRPGARLGPRGDGDHVRRAALAARAAARRARRPRPARS